MKGISKKPGSGLTLIELMVAILLLAIAVIGAMGFRYFCAMDARRADVQMTGARLGWMLLENWKASGGDTTYVPLIPGLTITPGPGPAKPADFTQHQSYHVLVNGAHLYATLSYKNATPTEARKLNVNVAWLYRYQQWDGTPPYKTVGLTTYME